MPTLIFNNNNNNNTTPPPPPSQQIQINLSFYEDLFFATLTSISAKLVTNSLEELKLVLQLDVELVKQGILTKTFTNSTEAMKYIVKEQGLGTLFLRGVGMNCIRYFPTQVLNSYVKTYLCNTFPLIFRKSQHDSHTISFLKDVISGGIAGGVTLIVGYPFEYIHTRLALDIGANGKRQFTSSWDLIAKTMKSDGTEGIYRGFYITIIGIFLYRGIYFTLYDYTIPYLPSSIPSMIKFTIGYCITTMAGILTYPIDTIRRRMIMTSCTNYRYEGYIGNVMDEIVAKDGIKSLFRGFELNIGRGLLSSLVVIGFDWITESYVKTVYGRNYYLHTTTTTTTT
jgi:solute carrier family 25 (adenine nucleotide translocator) protein 4/5/6/31